MAIQNPPPYWVFDLLKLAPFQNYYLDQDNDPKEGPITEDQKSIIGGSFEWPNTYWFIAERTNGRLAMIGFMAVIINYTLFGWIAYPIL